MRRALVLLAALAALTACGDDETSGASEDLMSPETTDAADPPEVVEIVSQSAAGPAEVSDSPTLLDSDAALERYLRQFDSTGMEDKLRRAVERVGVSDGRVVAAAVISLGCDVPEGATITEDDAGWRITPTKPADPEKECYVPVTSVAVLDLPAEMDE